MVDFCTAAPYFQFQLCMVANDISAGTGMGGSYIDLGWTVRMSWNRMEI